MTPDEHRRLEAVERRQAIAEERDRVADERMGRIEAKLDKLLALASMGKGAFWIVTRVGGVISFLAVAFFWAADHFRWWTK
jgi:hypothetical protein